MSIIQRVSYKKEDARLFTEKFGELLGVHKLTITLEDGVTIEGIVSEIGHDFIVVIEGQHDTIIPIAKILFCRYER